MTYLSLGFYIFLPLFFIVYYFVPQKYRYIAILAGSYLFYGYKNPGLLILLLITTIITYLGGIILEKNPKRESLLFFFAANFSILLIFKYTNFFIQNINYLSSKLFGSRSAIHEINIILPIGLSFYIFQSCTYLTDIYGKNIKAEKNFLRYAAFVSFFPTILSGPIQKSRELLPQIKAPKALNSDDAKKGTILFIWGLFEKIMVANHLALIFDKVYSDYLSYNSAYYIIAAISFSLYIYADFSSYSDMARGISKIMGINIGKNFNNPYLSTSTSEFWNRWHVSLNSWFIENIYIPLGGNRKGNFRKYINVFIVFLISGLWHGANWHFVAWGTINGLLVIVGQISKPLRKKIYNKLNVNETLESIRFLKKAIVFWLISITWVLFRNGISDSFYIIKKMVFFTISSFFDTSLFTIAGTSAITFVTIIVTIVFCIVQYKRQKETYYYSRFEKQPFIFQCALIALLIVCMFFSIISSNVEINTQFLYFQF